MPKISLIDHLRDDQTGKITVADFTDSVIGLFDDFLKDDSLLQGTTQGKIARLRARIVIDLGSL